MKKAFSIIFAAAALSLGTTACSEIEDGWTDIYDWEIPEPELDYKIYEPKTYTFNHPCMLHTRADIDYTKAHIGQQPWSDAYTKLVTNTGFCNVTYQASPVKYLARLDANNWGGGGGRWDDAGLRDEFYPGIHNNYTNFFRDCAAAYQLGLKWQLEGDGQAAAAAIKILEDWASVNKGLLLGRDKWKDDVIDSNEYLIMFQIHQAANAAELVRDYNNWGSSDSFRSVVNWMTTYFYPFCSRFIAMNNTDHWWMNWDLASMTAILSIGILADDQDMVNEAILHFKHGEGPGCIMRKGVLGVFDDPDGSGEKLAQGNESGRDQGHNTLCASMVGAFCQMAMGIGEDLFSFEDGRAIAFAQYVAKYNIVIPEVGSSYDKNTLSSTSFRYSESSLPFNEYTYNGGIMTGISGAGRGEIRPGWDIWAGYCNTHNIQGKYVKEIAEHFRPDGGGGHYGSSSGGFDQLGFSTLMHYREAQ
ncbi:MAG: alginate lyase family protein [Muribaculaceae bacterium]|nr:alginate lyase family protein [Muribaculaceae bacterium]